MRVATIPVRRLYQQKLLGPKCKTPQAAVEWLGAVQSQDYAAAKWALGLRVTNATDAMIENAFNEGRFLRTHVMRPTWHFIMPENITWMQQVTSSRVRSILASYDRKLEITPELRKKTNKILEDVLSDNNYKTRTELADEFEKHNIAARGQRLGHLMAHPELDALICSGPRRGKQFTYALVAERAPKQKKLTREEGLTTLATRYIRSHGPAQIKDLAWWAGLTIKDATIAIESIKSILDSEVVEDRTYWFVPDAHIEVPTTPVAFLLSIYDEFTIAYKDRRDIGDERIAEKLLSMGNALTAVVILDGRIVGTWKRTIKKKDVDVTVTLHSSQTPVEKRAIDEAIHAYNAFLDLDSV